MSNPTLEQTNAEFRVLIEKARDALQRYDVNGAILACAQIGEFFGKQLPQGINFQELFFTPEEKLKGDAKIHREMYNQLTAGLDVGLTDTLANLRGFIMDNVTSITQKHQTDKALGKNVSKTTESIMSDILRGIWVLSDVTDKQKRLSALPSDNSNELDPKGKFAKQLIDKITSTKEAIDKVWDDPDIKDKKKATQSLKTSLEQYQASFQALVEHTVANDVIPTAARSKLLEKVASETREDAKRLPIGERSAQLSTAASIQEEAKSRRKAVSFGESPLPVIGRRNSQDREEHKVSSPRINQRIGR